jgi:lipoate-protein ligase A
LPDVNFSHSPISGSANEDHALSRSLLDRVAAGQTDRAVRVWAPVPALALSRLDELRPGAGAATAAATRAGVQTVRRVGGGHAVVLGSGSFCAGFAEPAASFEGTQQRYERLSAALIAAFADVGVEAEHGALNGEWCPGTWSIRADGVKLAGLAQRAIKGAAWVEAVVDLAPDTAVRSLLTEVYAELDLPLDPSTLGSVSEVRGHAVGFDELAVALLERLAPAR